MVSKKDKNKQRLKRHARVRAKISGTTECPRLAVYRSNANIYAQIIDDVRGVTLVSASSIEAGFEGIGSNKEAAKKVGAKIAEKALAATIDAIAAELKNDGKIQLVGFGTFAVSKRAARTGINPRTKQPVAIAACKAPAFKAGKAFKDAVK